MESLVHIPNSLHSAGKALRQSLSADLASMSKPDFMRAWSSIFYLLPRLNPDGYEDLESGWPHPLKRFADEAWRRAGEGDLSDEELYPSDAQWCGIYDRLGDREPDEIHRRFELAANFGELSF